MHMGAAEPQGQPQQQEDRVEVRNLEEEHPRARADVIPDRTPSSYKVEGSVGREWARGVVEATVPQKSAMEGASVAFFLLIPSGFISFFFGFLAWLVAAPAVAVMVIATVVFVAILGTKVYLMKSLKNA
jgi:hypothetical protein